MNSDSSSSPHHGPPNSYQPEMRLYMYEVGMRHPPHHQPLAYVHSTIVYYMMHMSGLSMSEARADSIADGLIKYLGIEVWSGQ